MGSFSFVIRVIGRLSVFLQRDRVVIYWSHPSQHFMFLGRNRLRRGIDCDEEFCECMLPPLGCDPNQNAYCHQDTGSSHCFEIVKNRRYSNKCSDWKPSNLLSCDIRVRRDISIPSNYDNVNILSDNHVQLIPNPLMFCLIISIFIGCLLSLIKRYVWRPKVVSKSTRTYYTRQQAATKPIYPSHNSLSKSEKIVKAKEIE